MDVLFLEGTSLKLKKVEHLMSPKLTRLLGKNVPLPMIMGGRLGGAILMRQ